MSKKEVEHEYHAVINSLVAYRANTNHGTISDSTLALASEELAKVSDRVIKELHGFFAGINEEQTSAFFAYTIGRAMGFTQVVTPEAPQSSFKNISRIFGEGIEKTAEITKSQLKHGVDTGAFTIEQLKNNSMSNENVGKKSKKGNGRKIILPN